MQVANDWKIEDRVSGLRISVEQGKTLSRLHIEFLPGERLADNRDFFFFNEDGRFDGTGSECSGPGCDTSAEGAPAK